MDTSFLQKKQNFIAVFALVGVVSAVLTAMILGAGTTEIGLAVVVGAITGGIILGTYVVGRRKGHPHSHAVAEAIVSMGVLYLIAVAYRLLTEFGERSSGEVIGGMGALIVGFVLFIAGIVALGRYGPSPN